MKYIRTSKTAKKRRGVQAKFCNCAKNQGIIGRRDVE
jgi:hypothetical protein